MTGRVEHQPVLQTVSSAVLHGGRRQLLGLQALRGLAAALVVLAHLVEHGLGETAPHILLFGGRFGVVIFFVISGFVIHHAAGDRAIHPVGFAIRRLARIVPLYWATTLLVAALTVVAPQLYKTTVFDGVALFKSLFFIPYEFPAGSYDWRPLFKLGWTLNYEMFFYAAMLLLFWCRSARLRAIGMTVIIGALLIRSQLPRDPHTVIAFYANACLAPFLLGVWIAELWASGAIARLGRGGVVLTVAVAAMLTVALYAAPNSITGNSRTWMLVMMIPSGAMLIAALALEGEGRRQPFLQWIGDISYSMYLIHMFVVGALWAIAHRLLGDADGPVAVAGIIVAGFAVTLVASHISFRLFETPINRLGGRLARRIEQRDAAPEPGGLGTV